MNEGEKWRTQFLSGEKVDKNRKGLYGLDSEMSLLSVNSATTENPYLNEHHQEDSKANE